MKNKSIPFHVPYYGANVSNFVEKAISSKDLQGGGQVVADVEQRLSKYFGNPVFLTPSCTSALEIAALAAGFREGDEVLVPGYTFISSASSISRTGARPVFVDIEPETLCMDLNLVEQSITKRTKGIVCVHYAGQASPLEELIALAKAHNLLIIEDAAQAFACSQYDYKLGTVGDFGCFSFHDTKVFSSGEGGALVINNPDFLSKATIVREKGSNRREFIDGKIDKYGWVTQGTSGFMGGVSAALLTVQLDEMDYILAKRMQMFRKYQNTLQPILETKGWSCITLKDYERLNGHIFWIMAPDQDKRRALQGFLQNKSISVLPHYPTLYNSSYVKERGWMPSHELPISKKAAQCLLRLPLFYDMSEEQIDHVIQQVQSFLARC